MVFHTTMRRLESGTGGERNHGDGVNPGLQQHSEAITNILNQTFDTFVVLLVSQRHHGINLPRPPRRYITC